MIFKTFDSNIDKISAKWGIFGRSFNDIGTAIINKIIDFNDRFEQTGKIINSWKDTDSIWKRLYPSKESIQSKMTDVDALYPNLSDNEFSSLLTGIVDMDERVKTGTESWQNYFNGLEEGEKWLIDFVQNTDLQKASLDDVKAAYENARQAAITHNNALKQQTLSAKAANAAMKGLSIACNMLLGIAISLVINKAIEGIDNLIHKEENLREKLEETKSEYSETVSELKNSNDELDTTAQRMRELENKGKLTFTEREELDRLTKQNDELQRSIDLLELEQKTKNKEKNKTFVETMDTDVNNTQEYTHHHVPFTNISEGTYKSMSWSNYWRSIGSLGISADYATSEWGYIQEQFNKYEQLNQQLSQVATAEEKNRIQKQLDEIEKYLDEKSSQWETDSEGIDYIQNPTTDDEKKVNAWLDFISDFQDRMAIAMGGNNAKTNAFNRLIDNWLFDDTVQGLQDLGKEGKVTAEMLEGSEYDTFIQKLYELGVIDSVDNLDAIALAFNNLGTSAQEGSKSLDKSTTSLEELKKQLDSIQSAYDTVQSAVKEYNEQGFLSVDTVEALLSLEDEYLVKLIDENGQLTLNAYSFEQLAIAKLESYKSSIITDLNNFVKGLETEGLTVDELTAKYVKLATSKSIANGDIQTGYTDKNGNWVDVTQLDEYKAYLAKLKLVEESIKGVGKGGLQKSDNSTKDTADKAKETADKIKDINKKLKELDETQHLEDLKYSIETVNNELNKFEQTLDRLDTKLDSTFENDFTSKFQIAGQQFLQASRYGGEMRNELERLLAIEPQTADESEELASRLESLSDSFFENERQILEYRDSMYQTILDFTSASAEHEVDKANNAKSILDNTYSILENGSLSGGFWSRSLLPSISKDKVKQQRAENNKLIAEEERYQNAIADIRKKATDMAKAEADEERAEQKEEYLQDLAEAQNDYNSAIINTTQISTDSTNQIKAGVDGVSASLDTATQKANEFADAMHGAIGKNPLFSGLPTSADADIKGKISTTTKNAPQEKELIDTSATFNGSEIKALYNKALYNKGNQKYSFYVYDKNSGQYQLFIPDEKAIIRSLVGNTLHSPVSARATGGTSLGTTIVNEGTGFLAGREGYIGKDNKLHWFKDEKNLMFNTDDVVQIISAPDMANIIKYTGTKYFSEPIGNISSVSAYASGNTSVSFSPIPYNTLSDKVINHSIDVNAVTNQIIDEINTSFESHKGNISFDSLKAEFYNSLTDKSFYQKLSTGIGNMTEGSIDNADDNIAKSIKGLILQNSAWDDLPKELQSKFSELGANSDNWSSWINNSNNTLQAFNIMEGSGASSWDLLDQNIVALLQDYGIDGKEAWDTFIQENPLQALQLLVSSWSALEELIQQYMTDMISIATNGAKAIRSIQIEAPGISTASWDNLQTLIANKIQEVLNVINETFGNNTVDLNFSISTALSGNSQTNPQGVGSNSSVVNTAQQYLGVPYVWGGTSPSGFDCSGLMQYAFAQNGVAIPRTSQEQANSGIPVDKSNLQPGDMVFFSNESANDHVGMYVGNGQFIHAPNTGDVVKISSLNSDWYSQHYSGARRINGYASGTQGAKAGYAEIAEEYKLKGFNHYTPEIVIKKNTGKAYLAGLNGSEIWKLDQGDTVLPYGLTKELLEENGTKVNSYAKGTPNVFSFTKNLFKKKSTPHNTSNSVQEQPTSGTRIDVPDGLGKYTTYMEWYKVTDKSSLQYKLRNDAGENYTPEGFGVINGRLVLAMTSTFGGIGDYVDIRLSDGRVIKGIIGDEKSQQYVAWDHNPANQWGHENGQVIIEYVVQKGWNKGNPSLGGASVDYVENLGNYWGNPTFSGGATGTAFFNPYIAKYNEVLEKIKTLMGVFHTNTHTVTPKVSSLKSLGNSRQKSYDFDTTFTTHANGTKDYHIAGENYKPELMIDKKTGKVSVVDSPTIFDPNEKDIVGEKPTAQLNKSVKFYEKGNTDISVSNGDEKEYLGLLEKINKHMLEGNKLTIDNSRYTVDELKAIYECLNGSGDSEKFSLDKLDGILNYSKNFEDMEKWVEEELPDLLETYNQEYYESYTEEQKRYLDFQKQFNAKLEAFGANPTEGNYMERYQQLLAESNAETIKTLTTQTEMTADSIRSSLDAIKDKREVAIQAWRDAPTAALQKKALEVLKDLTDSEEELNETYADTMQSLTDHIVSSIENKELGFKSQLSFIEKDNDKIDRLINRSDDSVEKAQLTQQKQKNNARAIQILNNSKDAAHQSVMDKIYNSDNPEIQEVLKLVKFEEAYDANGEFNDIYNDNIELLNNTNHSDLVATYKQIAEIGKTSKQIWVEADDSLEEYIDKGLDIALETAERKIELQAELYDKVNKRLELRLNKEKAITSALEQQNSFQQELRDTALEYESQLIANKHLEEYLDEESKSLLFNDADYESTISEIDNISAEMTKKYTEYKSQISTLGDEDYYKEQKLTEKYNQEVEQLKEKLAVKKQELEVTKKNLEYNNTIKERDTRVIIGGRTINIADPDKLYNIELERSKAEKELDNLFQDNAENQQVRNMEMQSASTQEMISANEKYVDTLQNLDDAEKIRHTETMASFDELTAAIHALSTDYIPFLNDYEYSYRKQMASFDDTEWGDGYDSTYDHAEGQSKIDDLISIGEIPKSFGKILQWRTEDQRNSKLMSDPKEYIYSPQTTEYGGEIHSPHFAQRNPSQSTYNDYNNQTKEIVDAVKQENRDYTNSELAELRRLETLRNRESFLGDLGYSQTSQFGGIMFKAQQDDYAEAMSYIKDYAMDGLTSDDLSKMNNQLSVWETRREDKLKQMTENGIAANETNKEIATVLEEDAITIDLSSKSLSEIADMLRESVKLSDNSDASKIKSPTASTIEAPRGTIATPGNLKKYASGTKSAEGGLAITDEEGLEAKIRRLTGGRYTLLNEGDMIFNKAGTENLWKFANNPNSFLQDQVQRMLNQTTSQIKNINTYQDTGTNIHNTFSGDIVVTETIDNANEVFADAFRQTSSWYDVTKNMKR